MRTPKAADRLLIERSQSGDRRAFDQLVSRHQAQAYRYAFHLTRDRDEASDVVAETLLQMFKGIATFRGCGSFSTWMYRIAMNCYLDMRKRKLRLSTICLDASAGNEGAEPARQYEDKCPSAFDIAAANEDRAALGAVMLQLPEWQRTMIVMHHLELRTYEEMARSLKLPIGTVKSRLNRARHSLCIQITERQIQEVHLLPNTEPVVLAWSAR